MTTGAHYKKSGKNFKQGTYVPKNPEKYMGDVNKIRFMSSWELQTHTFFDNNPNVLRWASEEIAIPYIKPTDGRLHKYYPDYFVEYRNSAGEIIQEIIEVKPAAQVRAPRKNHKHALYEQLTYAINTAKWTAAARFCAERNIKFRIITEHSIFA
jgi:hypothetical protein